MSNPPPLIHVETNALDHAFMTAFSPAAEPTPTVEGRLDHIENRFISGKNSTVMQTLKDNTTLAVSLVSAVESTDLAKQTIKQAADTFSDCAKVVVKALDEVQKIHPFIAAPILVFKLVINLDIKRRENNKKVIMVQRQMQSMICVLLRLKPITPDELDEKGQKGIPLKHSLQGIMETITQDIELCWADCEAYLKKSLMRKYLKSSTYEDRFAGYVNRFLNYQTELERLLTARIAVGVDSANVKLDRLEANIQTIVKRLQDLDTAEEKKLRKLIVDRGGPESCLKDEAALRQLISESGETFPEAIVHGRGKVELLTKEELEVIQAELLKELAEDIDEAMKKNQAQLRKLLELQKKGIDETISKQGDRIINAVTSGPHERIKDEKFREIWRIMGWKSNVKARHFVLTLREVFGEQQNSKASLTYLQPIVETIDTDLSGFINVDELNAFLEQCPEGWTSLQWLSYWALGWNWNITQCKNELYGLLKEIYLLISQVLPINRELIGGIYFDDSAIHALEALLRSTSTISGVEDMLLESNFFHLHLEFTKKETHEIRNNLRELSYNIDSISVLPLVAGPGRRIEEYVYPLLVVLVRHHLRVMKRGCSESLSPEELYECSSSLGTVLFAVRERARSLEDIFKHLHRDPGIQFTSFAFGMFQAFRDGMEQHYTESTIFEVWKNGLAGTLFSEYGTPWRFNDDNSSSAADHLESTSSSKASEVAKSSRHSITSEDIESDGASEIPENDTQTSGHLREMELDPQEDNRHIDPHHSEDTMPHIVSSICHEGNRESDSGHSGDLTSPVVSDTAQDEGESPCHVKTHVGIPDGLRPDIDSLRNPSALLEGLWLGHCWVSSTEESHNLDTRFGLIELTVDTFGETTFTGSVRISNESYRIVGILNTLIESDFLQDIVITREIGGGLEWFRFIGHLEKISGFITGDWYSHQFESNEVQPSPEDKIPTGFSALGPFTFHRMPLDMLQFRYTSQEFDSSPVRSRWNYALSAVHRFAQFRLSNWNYIQQYALERKRFVILASKDYLKSEDVWSFESLTINEQVELEALKRHIPQSYQLELYKGFSQSVRRRNRYLGAYCDKCFHRICNLRFICITCMHKDFSNEIDLCYKCVNDRASRDLFNHELSHSLICTEYSLLKLELAWLIPKARQLSIHQKIVVRNLEDQPTRAVEDRPTSPHEGEASVVSEDLVPLSAVAVVSPPPQGDASVSTVSVPSNIVVLPPIDETILVSEGMVVPPLKDMASLSPEKIIAGPTLDSLPSTNEEQDSLSSDDEGYFPLEHLDVSDALRLPEEVSVADGLEFEPSGLEQPLRLEPPTGISTPGTFAQYLWASLTWSCSICIKNCDFKECTPFWICVICEDRICNDCFNNEVVPGMNDTHVGSRNPHYQYNTIPRHVWMRIYDSATVEAYELEQLDRVENGIEKVERSLKKKLDSLEGRLGTLEARVEERLGNLESQVNERLSGIEALLLKILHGMVGTLADSKGTISES